MQRAVKMIEYVAGLSPMITLLQSRKRSLSVGQKRHRADSAEPPRHATDFPRIFLFQTVQFPNLDFANSITVLGQACSAMWPLEGTLFLPSV